MFQFAELNDASNAQKVFTSPANYNFYFSNDGKQHLLNTVVKPLPQGPSTSLPYRLMSDTSTPPKYFTTTKTTSVMSPTFATTYSNGAVLLGTSMPANCTSATMGFNSISGSTHTFSYDVEQLPKTIDLEALSGGSLTTDSMPVTGFSFYSWNPTTSTMGDLDTRLNFLQVQGKNLVLPTTGATAVDAAMIKIDTFFGCV